MQPLEWHPMEGKEPSNFMTILPPDGACISLPFIVRPQVSQMYKALHMRFNSVVISSGSGYILTVKAWVAAFPLKLFAEDFQVAAERITNVTVKTGGGINKLRGCLDTWHVPQCRSA